MGWLAGSKLGRWLAVAALALALAWFAWQRARASGAEGERLAQRQRTLATQLTNLKERRHAEKDAGRRSAAERRQRVQRYLRRD